MLRRWQSLLRITLGLVGITASLLLAAHFFGLIPDESRAVVDGRGKLAETLAVQISAQAGQLQAETLQVLLDSVVERNDDVLSVALRDGAGRILVASGDHGTEWDPPPDDKSTPDDLQVPIYAGDVAWGNLELAFTAMPGLDRWSPAGNPVLALVLFVTTCGAVSYFFILRRSLRALDPNAVVPERVRAALDSLVEGVVILDEREQIVLANQAFGKRLGVDPLRLSGHEISDMNWRNAKGGGLAGELPWRLAMQTREVQTSVPLSMRAADGDIRTFMVNGTPILEDGDRLRGVLVTFDDVTDLERRHDELQRALSRLREVQEEVERQNKELRFLATRDPLTGCMNRRSLFGQSEALFERSCSEELPLSCVMLDIDRFKLINDRYGHATGDKVLAHVASILQANCREGDVLARYGGEEFCLVLPETDVEAAKSIAERIREQVSTDSRGRFTANMRVTVSAGVSGLPGDFEDIASLIDRADTALYTAKRSGRNRVIRWEPGQKMKSSTGSFPAPRIPESKRQPEDVQVEELRARIAELEASLEQRSTAEEGRDFVTGLLTHSLFEDRLAQVVARAGRRGSRAAVLHVDVDLFRRIKDVLGPAAGQELLKVMADRLHGLFRRSDTVALIGGDDGYATVSQLSGDEFGVLLDDLDKVESVTWIVQRIYDCLVEPLEVNGQEVFATCAIGISIFPEDGSDAETLMRHASAARQHARQHLGPNCFAFYSKEMTEQSYSQMLLEAELRRAAEKGEFTLHYQPKVVVGTGQLCGLEALIRWEHPEKGIISPAVFIPLAEQTGLINVIGDWVLGRACRQAALWLKLGLPPTRMAVNLSPTQLRSADLVDRIHNLLDSSGLPPHCLELEITESAVMEDLASVAQKLQALRQLGVYVSLDDFGTGYSSLSYLRKLPIDTLKIDRSFITSIAIDDEDRMLMSAVIALAHQLGIRVVAEGVETLEQLEALRALECDEAQGYLFSRPLPADEVSPLISDGRCWLPATSGSSEAKAVGDSPGRAA